MESALDLRSPADIVRYVGAEARKPWRATRAGFSLWRLKRSWRAKRDKIVPQYQAARPPQRVLVAPSDPWSLIGARGDDAMIGAAVGLIRAANPGVEVAICTASAAASAAAVARGFRPLEVWGREEFVDPIIAMLRMYRPDALVILGADIMDGAYGAGPAARLLVLADLAARSGVATTVLGFSFNARPAAALRDILDELHPNVRLNLRDTLSRERFSSFTAANAHLVADSAFLLQPRESEATRRLAAWADTRRAAGRAVLGFNIHPMLLKPATPAQVTALVERSAAALLAVAAERPVSWLLLPHDYRGAQGDDACLAPIADRLAARLGEDLLHLDGEHAAAELKAIAGGLDGVVAGRMHLAIASLGMGVPVLAITYQDKFEGLYRHFALPDWLLLSPQAMLTEDVPRERLVRFVDTLVPLREQVAEKLPAVRLAARDNFAHLL